MKIEISPEDFATLARCVNVARAVLTDECAGELRSKAVQEIDEMKERVHAAAAKALQESAAQDVQEGPRLLVLGD